MCLAFHRKKQLKSKPIIKDIQEAEIEHISKEKTTEIEDEATKAGENQDEIEMEADDDEDPEMEDDEDAELIADMARALAAAQSMEKGKAAVGAPEEEKKSTDKKRKGISNKR